MSTVIPVASAGSPDPQLDFVVVGGPTRAGEGLRADKAAGKGQDQRRLGGKALRNLQHRCNVIRQEAKHAGFRKDTRAPADERAGAARAALQSRCHEYARPLERRRDRARRGVRQGTCRQALKRGLNAPVSFLCSLPQGLLKGLNPGLVVVGADKRPEQPLLGLHGGVQAHV